MIKGDLLALGGDQGPRGFATPVKPTNVAVGDQKIDRNFCFTNVLLQKVTIYVIFFQISYAATDSNGIATQVDVRFNVDSVTWLSDDAKATLKTRLAHEITKDGFLIVKSGKELQL